MNTKKLAKSYSDESLAFLQGLMGRKQSLGGLILAIRKGEELTQEEFAKILKIPKQNLSDIENNRRSVSPSKAVLFAKKLGYSPIGFVRLALQDLLEREGIKGITVNIEKQAS
jgi:transcriptional regulator with XRE-family HTH domain